MPNLRALLLLAVLIPWSVLSARATPPADRPQHPMTLAEYMKLEGPPPSETVRYGEAPSQFVEAFVPPGDGPFPVAIVIHGGCWTKEYGGITQMRDMAAGLAAQGIAVWNVEYRRVDEAGGGYPGTYQDINAALDALADQASRLHLDLGHVVAIGHSAGGHLAQWLAARARVPAESPLHDAREVPVREVISLGGLADLRRQRARIARVCERKMVELTGRADAARKDPYADTSPGELLPAGVHTVLVNGAFDHQVPPSVAREFRRRAQRAGDVAETVVLPGASHFDEVAFHRPAWRRILPLVRRALALPVEPSALTTLDSAHPSAGL